MDGTWVIITSVRVCEGHRVFNTVPKVRGIFLWTDGSVIEYIFINRHKCMVIIFHITRWFKYDRD